MLKGPYGFIRFPGFALRFLWLRKLLRSVRAVSGSDGKTLFAAGRCGIAKQPRVGPCVRRGQPATLYRLDHDMAGSQGMLVNIKSLDRIWFPHFARCLEPMLRRT